MVQAENIRQKGKKMMEVLEFAKVQRRMCETYPSCKGCPLINRTCRIAKGLVEDDEEIVEIVEKWGEEHPIKTRQSEFLKLFPNARMMKDGRCLDICPANLNVDFKCIKSGDCAECCCGYWLKEIE